MSNIWNVSNEKLVIISLTSIAWITLIVMAICIFSQHSIGIETISLFITIPSAVVGALGGIYMGKKANPNNTIVDDTTTINAEPTINTEKNKQDNTNTENEEENLLEIQDKQ